MTKSPFAWFSGRGGLSGRVLLALAICVPAIVAGPAAAQMNLLPSASSDAAPTPAPATPSIDPGVDPQEDAAIGERLRTIYGTIDGLAPVQVRVTSGVVVLTGKVSAQALEDQAVRLARNVKGVAVVENRIVIAQDIQGRLAPVFKRLIEYWNGFVGLLPVLLLGLAIMAGAVYVGRWLGRRRSFYRHIAANDFIAGLVAQVVQGAVLIAGAGLTLLLLDATGVVKTLLGAAGILGLALGFALRDTVENYISSILLSVRRPFNPEDFVDIEGHQGIVARLTSRATVLLTLDGNQVRIPNATVFKGLIVNYTAQPRRRFSFLLGIGPSEDLARAQRTAIDALASVGGVLSDPPPMALYESVGDSAINLQVTGWMDQSGHDFLRVQSEAIRIVLSRMGEVGVDLPEPTLRLRAAPDAPPAGAGDTSAAVPSPEPDAIATTRDPSLNRVVEQERTGGTDLLKRDGARE